MTPRPQPLRIFAAMLRVVSSRDAANAAIGDIFDELNELNTAGSGPIWPALWLNSRVAGAIVWSLLTAIPRLTRVAVLILRDAFRSVRRSPAHSLFITAVLALAMSAGTVTFSVVDAVVLTPMPFAEPDRVVFVPSFDQTNRAYRLTPDAFWQLHDHPSSLESVTTISMSPSNNTTPVTIGPVTDVFPTSITIADTFHVFRMTPALGRFWTADEEARGDTDVAVLSHRVWQRELGGSPDVLGMTVTVYKRTLRVIGVASAQTEDANIPLLAAAVWFPRPVTRDDKSTFASAIGRMKPGVTVADVAADVQRILGTGQFRPDVKRFADVYTSRVSGWMLLALGASGLVVLIACVNAANLMLTRSVERLRETGVRVSLGASRSRVAAGAITEGLILSSFAAVAALLFAAWGIATAKAAMTTLPLGVFRGGAIALNGRVFAAAVAAAIVTGLLVAIVPAWQASRASVVTLLKDSAPTTAGGRGVWRTVFLVTEIAAVAVLFVVSWLFVVSLIRSVNVDIGVDRDHLIGVNPSSAFNGTVDDVRARIEQLPGVSAVALSRGASPPIFGRISGAWITNTFVPAGSNQAPVELLDHRVTANFFDVMGIRFIRGSGWSGPIENEPFASAPVVLDEQAATRLFGDLDPIGRQVVTVETAGVHTVIGLVPYVRGRGPEEAAQLAAYFPLRHDPARTFASLLVRTSGSPDALVPAVADAANHFSTAQGWSYVYSANDALRRITATRRFTAFLMSAFGLVGALIGAAGIYAVMASVVAQKTREIGVRVALGATSRDIQRQILTLALKNLMAGLLIGLPIAWWLSRGFTALLFQVTPADVSVYVGVATLLCFVGLAAAVIPSRRAARVDPIICLRAQ